uniref:Cilia- and flagella-associated protein 299 n=1 Tax=Stomoxys calcitrans TaxID=35570 RepID=A0A1I8PKH5_STOCA
MNTINQDMFLLDCPTYEDYLDTFITLDDQRFIRNIRVCRMLVDMGYRSKTEIYSREEFQQHKAAVEESLWPIKKAPKIFSDGMKSTDAVLIEMAARERPNVQKMISTIIFLEHRLKNGFMVSGYIDYEDSLHLANQQAEGCTDWSAVFGERIKLKPKRSDLSYYDWLKKRVSYNESRNYIVLHDLKNGLIFMHKGDRKKICMDDKKLCSENVGKSMQCSQRYGLVTFYDHVMRKKI